MNPWCIHHDRDEEQEAMDLESKKMPCVELVLHGKISFSTGIIVCSINAPLTGAFITSDKAL